MARKRYILYNSNLTELDKREAVQVLTGKLRFKQAVRLYQQRLSDYEMANRAVH